MEGLISVDGSTDARDVRLPYPPDTSPPPADSIARQFHRLTIADSSEDNCE